MYSTSPSSCSILPFCRSGRWCWCCRRDDGAVVISTGSISFASSKLRSKQLSNLFWMSLLLLGLMLLKLLLGETNAITEVGDDTSSTINNITPTVTTDIYRHEMYSAPLSEPPHRHKTVNMTHTTNHAVLSLPILPLPRASLVIPFTAIATTVASNTAFDTAVAFTNSYYCLNKQFLIVVLSIPHGICHHDPLYS